MLWVMLNSRRGRIEGMDTRQAHKSSVLRCLCPKCSDIPQHFVRVHKAVVYYSMELSHYEEVPKSIAEEIIAKGKGA